MTRASRNAGEVDAGVKVPGRRMAKVCDGIAWLCVRGKARE